MTARGHQSPAGGSVQLLDTLARQVRTLRAHRRMTRKSLAQNSGVSERYLAQLENGEGNASVVLLGRIADALQVTVADLLRVREPYSAEEVVISDVLRDMSPDSHKAVLQMLAEQFPVSPGARRRVALIGLRGSGKTSQGRKLAERLGIPFVQLGHEIELLAGMSTLEIFSLSGQSGYRRLEEKALMQSLRKYDRCVLETGGGIVTDKSLLNTLLTTCFVVWLSARPEDHMQRLIAEGDVRPMQDSDDAISSLRRILAEREEHYAKAHVVIDTSGKTVDQCVDELLRLVPEGAERAAAQPAGS